MSKTIDEKVVEMRFDNRQFESNVQTSLSTIEKLKKSLDMDGATKGFESIDSAVKKIDISSLGSAVESVRLKFSALEVIAVAALTNITSSVINTGKQLISSLSVDQVSAGWDKLAKKTTSVATLISQGYDMSTVEDQLGRLNWFTDETSYNFTDMVDSISKFTAAGQDLETSVSAMEGIANWAALSGQNASTASRAMYQLSQAMGAGVMRLEDYKSIQTANMDTAEFRQKCLDAAVALGTLREDADGTYMSIAEGANKNAAAFTKSQFTTQLTNGAWLTSEVMMKVFNDYGATVDQIYEYSEEKGITASQAIEELGGSVDEFGLKAFLAAQEAKTFGDAIDATKDAVSTGWMNTFELIFGNYEEQRVLWTDLANAMYDAFAAGAEDRNSMLETWAELGGRTTLIETFWTAWENVSDILRTVKEAFREVFPKMTGKRLYELTENLKTFVEKCKLSDTALDNLKSTFKGLFALLDIIKQAFSIFKPLFGGFGTLGEKVLDFTGNIGDAIVEFDEFIKTSDVFQKIGEGIAKAFQTVISVVGTFKNWIKEKLDTSEFKLFHSLLERVQTRMSQVGEAAGGMKSAVTVAFEAMGDFLENCQFIKLLSAVWNAIKSIAGGIAKVLGGLTSNLVAALSDADFSDVIDLLNGISIGGIAIGITKFLKSVSKPLDGLKGILDGVTGILDGVRGCFEAYQQKLKAGTLLKIASAIAILTASIVVISLIDSDKLAASLGTITALFADLMASMAVFNKISGKSSGLIKSVAAMLGISIAVLILANALKKIANLDMKQLATGLIGVAGLTAMMVASAKLMSHGGKTIIKGAMQMVLFAVAIKILASACEDLSELNWNQLAKGLVGVGVLLAEVSLFMRTAKFSGKTVMTATGIVILSAAIKVLASACKDFSEMRWEEIGKGLSSIAILLTEITLFTRLTGNAKNVVSTGIALIAIGAAMKIFASACEDFSGMQWEEIARGLVAMAGALTVTITAVKFMPKNMVSVGVGLIAVATALVVIVTALEKMGSLTWEEIAKGLITLGGAVTILAIGLNAMNGTLSGSAALLVAAAAILVFTPALSVLGAMSWESIAKGLIALAGAFAIIGVAGLVLAPLVPAILGLSGAMALIGAAIFGIGAGLVLAGTGLSALAIGLTAFATASAASTTAIVAYLTVVITAVVSLIPVVIAKIGEGIIEFCKVIVASADAIGEAVKAVILTLIDVFIECVPSITEGVLMLIVNILDALVRYAPSIVDSIFQFLIEILDGIARNLPALIQAAIDVLMSFFSGIVDALKGIDTKTLIQGIVGIGLLAAIMVALNAVAVLTPGALLGVLGMGAVIAELALVLAAIGALAQIPGLSWLIDEGGDLLQGIGTAIGKFVGGIVGGLVSGVSSQFPQIGTDLSDFMTNAQPFLDGAASIDSTVLDGVKALAETILILTAANILDGLTSWFTGESSLSGFAEEMVPFGKAMKQFSDEIDGIDSEAVSNAAIAGKTLAEMADTLPNSGGVVGFFAGENDMGAFGDQLVPFGKAMKDFAQEVTGLDSAVVQEAATAGKALAEMADTLPNSGGVVGFFTGENDMDEFGNQLVPFGKAMKDFADSVSGLDADVIQNSVTAGKALVELADTVPNTGGLVDWFTGSNDLGTFSEQLIPFGTAMKDYSLAVTGIDADVVTNSANAAKALVELSNNLPTTGGISSWFTGDNDIATFGEDLVPFGKSLAEYYNNISGIDVDKLSGVVDEFRNIIDLANDVKSVDTSGISTFAKDLSSLGNSGINEFISAFSNANSRIKDAVNSVFNEIISTFASKYSQFTMAGQMVMSNFISGIKSKDFLTRKTYVTIISGCLNSVHNRLYAFNAAGQVTMTNFIAGIKLRTNLVKESVSQIIDSCQASIRYRYSDFYSAGKYLVDGFTAGINEHVVDAEAQARAMAKAAAQAVETELDINSPSKVGYRIGGFFGLGFVKSITDYTSQSYDAGASIAVSAKEGLRNAVTKIGDFIENGIESQPTIRPVLDLSDVSEGAARLSALLSRSQALKISSNMERKESESIQNGNVAPLTGNSYNFTQNNYSPKALSRADIYRQTKNQFSTLKGLVET